MHVSTRSLKSTALSMILDVVQLAVSSESMLNRMWTTKYLKCQVFACPTFLLSAITTQQFEESTFRKCNSATLQQKMSAIAVSPQLEGDPSTIFQMLHLIIKLILRWVSSFENSKKIWQTASCGIADVQFFEGPQSQLLQFFKPALSQPIQLPSILRNCGSVY
jgi:hypothetical protein